MEKMDIDPSGFLWLEEHKLVLFLIKEQEAAIAWDLCEWEKTLTVMGSWVSMYEEESHRLPGQKSAHLIACFKTINAMKARQNFGQMLEEVYYKGEQFIIERAGKPMAAVIPLSKFAELQKHHSQPKMDRGTIKESKRRSNKGRA